MAYTTDQIKQIDQQLFAAIISRGVSPSFAKIIVAQARLESGNYTSKRFQVNKNAFGYTYNPNSPWQSGKGGKMPDANGYYANYANFTDGGKELGDYAVRKADKFKGVTTPAQYATIAKSLNYFKAPLAAYIKLITNRYNALSHLDAGAGTVAHATISTGRNASIFF